MHPADPRNYRDRKRVFIEHWDKSRILFRYDSRSISIYTLLYPVHIGAIRACKIRASSQEFENWWLSALPNDWLLVPCIIYVF